LYVHKCTEQAPIRKSRQWHSIRWLINVEITSPGAGWQSVKLSL